MRVPSVDHEHLDEATNSEVEDNLSWDDSPEQYQLTKHIPEENSEDEELAAVLKPTKLFSSEGSLTSTTSDEDVFFDETNTPSLKANFNRTRSIRKPRKFKKTPENVAEPDILVDGSEKSSENNSNQLHEDVL